MSEACRGSATATAGPRARGLNILSVADPRSILRDPACLPAGLLTQRPRTQRAASSDGFEVTGGPNNRLCCCRQHRP